MFIKDLFGKEIEFSKEMEGEKNATIFGKEALLEQYYKEFAVESCISIIANALSLADFQTYMNFKKVKLDNYYLLNVEPNVNQNAKEFWHKVISNLYYKNECLIIQEQKQFYVADGFSREERGLKEDLYKEVYIGEYNFTRTFKESEVMYLKLNNTDIKKLIDGLYTNYGQLLTSGIKNYKRSNGMKGFVEIDTSLAQTEEAKKQLQDLMENQFSTWFKNDDAILPLSKGFTYKDSTPNNGSATKATTRDIRAIVDDIIEFTCAAFHVPSAMVKGNMVGVTEQTDNFLAFCINPLAKLIESEINRKMYKKSGFSQGSYVKIDTLRIKNIDLQKMANAGDLLFRIGVNSINDNLEMLGKEKLDADYADEHYVTKNYQSVLDINNTKKGGEIDGEKNGQS